MTNDRLKESGIEFTEHDGGIGVLTFKRPEHLNTFRAIDYLSFSDALKHATDSQTLRVIIITGTGRAFSAGQDLSELDFTTLPSKDEQRRLVVCLQDITRAVVSLRIPTIAAFNGLAVGFGLEVALACDFRIAAPDSYFMFSEAKRGLFPSNGVLWLLPRLIGPARAKEMLLFGDKFSADYALKHGLVSEVVPQETLMNRAFEMAQALANNASDTIFGIRDLLTKSFDMTLEQMLEQEVESNLRIMEGTDFAEGVKAFLEKRQPHFNGYSPHRGP